MRDLFSYPNSPGWKARDTSRAAAESIKPTAGTLRAQVLAIYWASRGLTADEAAGLLGKSILSVRPRVAELARMGLLRDTGERRVNASGKTAIVWHPQ